MKRVLIIVVVVGAMVAFKMVNRTDDSGDVKSEMHEIIVQMDHYEGENVEFLDGLFERAHERAFQEAYSMGGRRRGASFDDEVYVKEVLSWMIKECNMRNRRELVDELQAMRDAYERAPEE